MNEDSKKLAEEIFGKVKLSRASVKPFDREEHESKDRTFLAKVLVVFFLIGLFVILVLVPIYNTQVAPDLRLDVFNLFSTYSGTLGPFVGVIAGYFFKK